MIPFSKRPFGDVERTVYRSALNDVGARLDQCSPDNPERGSVEANLWGGPDMWGHRRLKQRQGQTRRLNFRQDQRRPGKVQMRSAREKCQPCDWPERVTPQLI